VEARCLTWPAKGCPCSLFPKTLPQSTSPCSVRGKKPTPHSLLSRSCGLAAAYTLASPPSFNSPLAPHGRCVPRSPPSNFAAPSSWPLHSPLTSGWHAGTFPRLSLIADIWWAMGWPSTLHVTGLSGQPGPKINLQSHAWADGQARSPLQHGPAGTTCCAGRIPIGPCLARARAVLARWTYIIWAERASAHMRAGRSQSRGGVVYLIISGASRDSKFQTLDGWR